MEKRYLVDACDRAYLAYYECPKCQNKTDIPFQGYVGKVLADD